jgi:hypothetical protein
MREDTRGRERKEPREDRRPGMGAYPEMVVPAPLHLSLHISLHISDTNWVQSRYVPTSEKCPRAKFREITF